MSHPIHKILAELVRLDFKDELPPVKQPDDGSLVIIRIWQSIRYNIHDLCYQLSPSGVLKGLLTWGFKCLLLVSIPSALLWILLVFLQQVLAAFENVLGVLAGGILLWFWLTRRRRRS